ncbi:hypothetical protein ABB02_00539 [Clostridiaceae bacterium JG1575]|nr:hypothetical protein ABB02_00539 [Clostridiaceae bacterium JG1575]
MNHLRRRRPLLLILTFLLFLTGCQRTTQVSYDQKKDPFAEAARIMNDLGIDYQPEKEKITVLVTNFGPQGIGYLQEHRIYDFGTVAVRGQKGNQVVVSLPYDPKDGKTWRMVLNEYPVKSQPFMPEVVGKKPEIAYNRMNFLLSPPYDGSIAFRLMNDEGEKGHTFRVDFSGFGDAATP